MLPGALLVVAVLGYLISSKPDKDKLIKNLNAQLKAETFEQLYEEADDSIHLDVTKERFVKRMKIAATKLKAIDENLTFQRDLEMESWTGHADGPYSLAAYQKLEKDGKAVTVCFNWTTDGRFRDVSVLPSQELLKNIGCSASQAKIIRSGIKYWTGKLLTAL